MEQPNWLLKLFFGQQVGYWSDFAHMSTGYRYVTLTGRPPATWPETWHVGTGWVHYRQPEAAKIAVPKTRWRSVETVAFRWPELFKGAVIRQSDPGRANMYGQGPGLPIQAGTSEMRSVTYGWAVYGEQARTKIPKPASGRYWLSGAPKPAYDKTAIVVAPGGTVYELIQFDPFAGESPVSNQALGVGVFRDGLLVEGKPTGAGQVANSAYIWDRLSADDPHTQLLVLADYNGHDGLLPSSLPNYDVPKIGDLFVLDPRSASAKNMLAKGGDCAARASALIAFGARVLDRSGYSDAGNNSTQTGSKPHPPVLMVQAGSWPGSNIGEFEVALEDFRFVTSFEET